jgi:hypothetical protein
MHHVCEVGGEPAQAVLAARGHVPPKGPDATRAQFTFYARVGEPAEAPDLVVGRQGFGHRPSDLARPSGDEDLFSHDQ